MSALPIPGKALLLFHQGHMAGPTRDPKRTAMGAVNVPNERKFRSGPGLVIEGIRGGPNCLLNEINASVGLDRAIELAHPGCSAGANSG